MKRYLLVCLTVVAVSLAGIHLAQAGGPSPYLAGYGYDGYGWGYGNGYYSIYGNQDIPFYAKHPPVYYSYPVPRPYGWSPFAYPPGVLTPESNIELIEAEMIDNPYVPDPVEVAPSSDSTAAVRPQVIVNPYVVGDHSAGQLASDTRPQVVYPAQVDPTN